MIIELCWNCALIKGLDSLPPGGIRRTEVKCDTFWKKTNPGRHIFGFRTHVTMAHTIVTIPGSEISQGHKLTRYNDKHRCGHRPLALRSCGSGLGHGTTGPSNHSGTRNPEPGTGNTPRNCHNRPYNCDNSRLPEIGGLSS